MLRALLIKLIVLWQNIAESESIRYTEQTNHINSGIKSWTSHSLSPLMQLKHIIQKESRKMLEVIEMEHPAL